jgi:hypothetical protein
MVISIFGRVLAAKWNIIDDHEIMLFLGSDRRLYLGQVFSTFSLTEIGNFGSLSRYRPSYYLLRIMESVIWGANPLYWHAFRIIILILSTSLFWMLMSSGIGFLEGGLLSAYALTFIYLKDVIGSLGPGETYAVLGLPIYIWGIVNIFQKSEKCYKPFAASLAILTGSVICVGSKENFLLLIIPSLFVSYKAFKFKMFFPFLCTLGSLIYSVYIGFALTLLLWHNGADVYGNSTSPMVRMANIINSLINIKYIEPFILLCGLTVAVCFLLLVQKYSAGTRATLSKIAIWFVVICVVYFSQLIFYNGVWPTGNRYDFPGILYIPVTIYLLSMLFECILFELSDNQSNQFIVRSAFCGALAVVILMKGYTPISLALDEYVKTTIDFTDRLDRIALLLKNNKEYALVIESGDVWDYEPIISYERFLRSNGVKNQIFLRIHGYSQNSAKSGLEKSLTDQLIKISTNGDNNFEPIFQLKNFYNACFSLELSGNFKTECQYIQ